MIAETAAGVSSELHEALARALDAERERYGQAPELSLDSAGALRGFVVTRGQGERIAQALGSSSELLVPLEDLSREETSIGWKRSLKTLDGWAAPEGGKLQNQVLAGEVLRLLAFPSCAGRRLAQTQDRAMAWYAEAELQGAPSSAAELGRCLGDGEFLEASAAQIQALCEAARAMMGRPYRLGGRDPSTGLDCSALVGGLIREVFGCALPRHSGDQRILGAKVAQSKVQAGDLLFATSKARKISHVAIFVGSDRLVHACLREQRVIEESLAEFLEAYDWRSARRLWKDLS